MESGKNSARRVAALVGLAGVAALAIPASASAATTCNLAGDVLQVDVTGTGDQVAGVRMNEVPNPDEVEVFSDVDLTTEIACTGGPPTVANTNAIDIADEDPGTTQRTRVVVSIAGGRFVNADTNGEGPGDTEIEIVIDGAGEADDQLILEGAVEGGPGNPNDNWRMGVQTSNGQLGIQLEESETGSFDVDDVQVLNMEQALFDGGTGNDSVDARGEPQRALNGPFMAAGTSKEMIGGPGLDSLKGGDGTGWRLEGGPGADEQEGGSGNDLLLLASGADNEFFDANGGTDECSFAGHPVAVTVDLGNTSFQDTVGAGEDFIRDCENLTGGDGNDTLIGDPGANTLSGGPGDDTLRPGTGLVADSLVGGAGNGDAADYSDAGSGVQVDLSTAVAQDTVGAGSDTIGGTENLTGSAFADTLSGTTSANNIVGGDGVDTINLGGDDDTFDSFDAVGDTVNCGLGMDSGFTSEPGVDTLNPDCETPGIDPAPNTTIASGPAEGAATNAPTYGLIASEGGVQFQVSADNGAFANCAATCQVPGLADGAHTLRFRAVETAGAQHPDPTPAQRAVVVDRRAPAVQIDSGPSGETTQTTATFGFSSDDAQATYQCSVDGAGFGPCGGANSHTASGLGLGAHTFEVRAADAAGNAASATRAFTVVPQAGPNPPAGDTTPPDTAIRKPKVKGKGAKLTFSSTEPGSTFTCKLDREKAAPCTSPQSYRKLKKGKHNVLVTATDAAGNADPSPAKAKFKIKK